ncbi:MAG: hypothetical protein QGH25_22710, partial [Candidatus Latescibacteria bacterium]|nr:hypothetical protein [Candidatus Latescibacterota bacterium]
RRGVEGYRIYRSADGAFYEEIGRVGPGVDSFVDHPHGDPAVYRYKVLAEDRDNWREAVIVPGSAADSERTIQLFAPARGVDAAGAPVAGLFDDDLDVDLDDFFLFADHFGRADGEETFDVRFDLDGDGTVDLDDFFTLADHFGQVAVSR